MAMPAAIVTRRLAAIFSADVAGYTRLMNADEVATLRLLGAHREIADRLIAQNGGRIANTAGDSILAEFPSAMDALQCALAVQERIAAVNAEIPLGRRVVFRIGIHVSEVMVHDGDIFGDSVNIAARLQSLAEPGYVCLSGAARDYAHRILPLAYDDLGLQAVKNVDKPIHCYKVRPSDEPAARSIPRVHRRNEANLIRRSHELLRNTLTEITAPHGLDPIEIGILASLGEAPDTESKTLSARVGLAPNVASRFLKHLRSLDLIEPGGPRGAGFRLTPAGSDLTELVRPTILAAIDRVMAPLSGAERETLLDLLARVIKANEARADKT